MYNKKPTKPFPPGKAKVLFGKVFAAVKDMEHIRPITPIEDDRKQLRLPDKKP